MMQPINEPILIPFRSDNIYGTLEVAIDTLPCEYSLPIHLRYIEQLGLIEIAQILAESPKVIREKLKGGLEKLSRLLLREGVLVAGLPLMGLLNDMPEIKAPELKADAMKKILGEVEASTAPEKRSNADQVEIKKSKWHFQQWCQINFEKPGDYLRHIFAKHHQY